METYKEKYRPRVLKEIAGQPAVASLQAIVAAPHPCCLLLHGPTGTGKSSAAQAIARQLGCYDDVFETAYTICGADLDADSIRRWFGPETPFRFRAPRGWHVLIVEELELLSKTAGILLKDCLERKLLQFGNVIVAATSNSTAGIPAPVLDRFKQYAFAGGAQLSAGMGRYIAAIWKRENPDAPLPQDWKSWGWDGDSEEFSARRAIDACEEAARLIAVRF
jgi:replication-associated recombination protein RarA